MNILRTVKCSVCKRKLEAKQMMRTGLSWWCSSECGTKLAMKLLKIKRDSYARVKKKENAAQKKAFNENDLKWQHNRTKITFNRVRVKQEKLWFLSRKINPFCISCKKENMDWACGHFKTTGSQGNLRYDEKNTYLQCNRYCNMGLSGNINGNKNTVGYTEGIKDRFGADKGNRIIRYCTNRTEVKKWTCEEVQAIREEYLLKEKKLNEELSKYEKI